MSLSFGAGKMGLCCLAALLSASSFAQTAYHNNGSEYALAGALAGTQTHPALSLNSSGGYLVWEDNSIGGGMGIRAVGLDPNFSQVMTPFRVNQNGTGDQAHPQVALLQAGGAVFVWEGGKLGFHNLYARFISSSNTWLTGDVKVNSPGGVFQRAPAVATLADGNVIIIWASFNKVSSTSMQDVFGQLFSPTGQKIGSEFRVNQFSSFNQRTPAVAALSSGGFVVSWISEQQRSGPIDNADSSFVYTNLPTVDIYARLFLPNGQGVANEFIVNTVSDVCANPSVAAAADGGFLVAWSQKDLASRSTGWDVVSRIFSSDGTGGETRMVNTYRTNDQFAPQASVAGSDYLVVWTSIRQDGAREGVYGQFLASDGNHAGGEFRVNSTTASRQMQPALASDHAGRFLAVWSSFVGGSAEFDLYGKRYDAASFVPPAATPYFYGTPPTESFGGGGSSDPGSSDSGSGAVAGARLDFPAGSSGTPLPNGMTLAAGTYNGLFYSVNGITPGGSGYVTAKTTAQGSYSAKLNLAGKTYSLSGRFDAAGRATNTVARVGASALKVELQLDLSGGDQLRGRVSSGNWSSDLLADRVVWSKT
ncbi:MAG TPA: hypothetical protein VN794_20585, partial [Methylomirabilota bacterium]|nr:hypothetical protein [Methylomirabilota bacterium]